jgi:alpha-galactosidase
MKAMFSVLRRVMNKGYVGIILLVCSTGIAGASGWDDLAKTPPMGWNSWNTFRLNINEAVVRGIADMFVDKGFADAGYKYIVIDDGWQIDRDAQQTMQKYRPEKKK